MKSANKETWRNIPGTDGAYRISNKGRILSMFFNNRVVKNKPRSKPLLLKLGKSPKGYLGACIRINGRRKTWKVHTLVLETFGMKRPPGKQCAHLNGIPSDNRFINLKWASPKENQEHRRKHGTYLFGETATPSKLSERSVREIISLYGKGINSYARLAKRYGVSKNSIKAIIYGQTWMHIKRPKIKPKQCDQLECISAYWSRKENLNKARSGNG